ncbi:sulfite exporter TauE/SafE family protein [Natronorubrum sp. A-ect3]|uniref:sulfite exporter TauE/SafE family protein n=1 Tax=Natronorubrum sp. A-ect3 TaxID=3242698 RepID=UPI00359DAFD6
MFLQHAAVGAVDPVTAAFILAALLLAGVVTGIAGFGFALVGTMALATVVDPSLAVVLMIVPILATNVSLLGELDADAVRSCSRRFWPYVLATLVGTLVGMAALESIPADPLTITLGFVTLAYVGATQRAVSIPGRAALEDRCFVERRGMMVGLGTISGVVFGATNVGVQVVAYIRSRDLEAGLFVGVLALVFVGINAVRVGAAVVFGLYPSLAVGVLSVALAIPALAGVLAGRRVRPQLSERIQRQGVLALLALIGGRLVLGGLGIA